MASLENSSQRRESAIASIQSTAAALAERFNVPNTVETLDYGNQHLENMDKSKSALFQALLAERDAGILTLVSSILEKLTPAD